MLAARHDLAVSLDRDALALQREFANDIGHRRTRCTALMRLAIE